MTWKIDEHPPRPFCLSYSPHVRYHPILPHSPPNVHRLTTFTANGNLIVHYMQSTAVVLLSLAGGRFYNEAIRVPAVFFPAPPQTFKDEGTPATAATGQASDGVEILLLYTAVLNAFSVAPLRARFPHIGLGGEP